jgi:hypothetical protein
MFSVSVLHHNLHVSWHNMKLFGRLVDVTTAAFCFAYVLQCAYQGRSCVSTAYVALKLADVVTQAVVKNVAVLLCHVDWLLQSLRLLVGNGPLLVAIAHGCDGALPQC